MIPALDAEMTAVHRHTSTCLEGRHFLGVPIIHGPPSPFPPPPLSLPCFPVRQGDVPHGAAPSVCRLILNFSATAVGFLSRRSGLKIVRRLSLFSLSRRSLLLPIATCPLSPPVHRPALGLEVSPEQSRSTVLGAPGESEKWSFTKRRKKRGRGQQGERNKSLRRVTTEDVQGKNVAFKHLFIYHFLQ